MNQDDEDRTGYIDGHGVEMDIGYKRALEVCLDLATQELQTEAEARADEALDKWRFQTAAVGKVRTLLEAHGNVLDTELRQSTHARDWPGLGENLKDGSLIANMKIVHGLATCGAIEPGSTVGVEMADHVDLQQASIDLLADMIGLNGDILARLDADEPGMHEPG